MTQKVSAHHENNSTGGPHHPHSPGEVTHQTWPADRHVMLISGGGCNFWELPLLSFTDRIRQVSDSACPQPLLHCVNKAGDETKPKRMWPKPHAAVCPMRCPVTCNHGHVTLTTAPHCSTQQATLGRDAAHCPDHRQSATDCEQQQHYIHGNNEAHYHLKR